MNLPTLKLLKNKITNIITPLNNKKYMESVLPEGNFIEMDWYE